MSSIHLPWTVVYPILDNLPDSDLLNFCQVAKALRAYCQSNSYWRHRIAVKFGGLRGTRRNPQLWYQRLRSLDESPDNLVEFIREALQEGEDSIVRYLARQDLQKLSANDHYRLGRLLARYNYQDLLLEILELSEVLYPDEQDREIYLGFFVRDIIRGAIEGNHLDLVLKILDVWIPKLERDHSVEFRNILDRALQFAAGGGNLTMTRLFLDRGATGYQDAIYEAASGGYEPIVRLLLSRAPDESLMALRGAAREGHVDLLEKLLDESELDTVALNQILHETYEAGRTQIVRELLRRGADDFTYALMVAARSGDLDLFAELEQKFDPSLPRPIFLIEAVEGGNLGIVREILKGFGRQIPQRILQGPILRALELKREEILRFLLTLPGGSQALHSIEENPLKFALGQDFRKMSPILQIIAGVASRDLLELILKTGVEFDQPELIKWALNQGARNLDQASSALLSFGGINRFKPATLRTILREYQRLYPEKYPSLVGWLIFLALGQGEPELLKLILQESPGVVPSEALLAQIQANEEVLLNFLSYEDQSWFDRMMTGLLTQGWDLSQILPRIEGYRLDRFIERARAAGQEDLIRRINQN